MVSALKANGNALDFLRKNPHASRAKIVRLIQNSYFSPRLKRNAVAGAASRGFFRSEIPP